MTKIRVEYTKNSMETEGMYVPELNLIILDGTRCEDTQKKCLLHELAHAKLHQDCHQLYTSCSVNRLKMEHEANTHMVDNLIDHALAKDDVELEDINWVDFASNFDLDPYLVRDVVSTKK